MNATYGYIRVSSKEQNETRQLIEMQALVIPTENLFIDKQSGRNFSRPNYRNMLRILNKVLTD